MEKLIFAVDFDGTITEKDEFPHIGAPNMKMVEFIKKQQENHIIILNTCRVGEYLDQAVAFCQSLGIRLDCANENHSSRIEKYGGDTRKISADFYIDDKSMFLDCVNDRAGRECNKLLCFDCDFGT